MMGIEDLTIDLKEQLSFAKSEINLLKNKNKSLQKDNRILVRALKTVIAISNNGNVRVGRLDDIERIAHFALKKIGEKND